MQSIEQWTEHGVGSAEKWGPLWGARPRDWAAQEAQQTPTYEAVLDRLAVGPGDRLLDIGCGAGVMAALAEGRGARVTGVDASEALLELARERLPGGDFRRADMESLPFEDDAFDQVTGFNSFFFAADMIAALREARRVARSGAPVAIQVWGRPERCDLEAMKEIARGFAPRPADTRPAPKLWEPGMLEEIASEAGLEPGESFDLSWSFEYADAETLGRQLMAPMGLAALAGPEREPEVRARIVAALEPHRSSDGSFSLRNEFHVLIAIA